MSLDLNVYVHQIDDAVIPKWIERMNQMGSKPQSEGGLPPSSQMHFTRPSNISIKERLHNAQIQTD